MNILVRAVKKSSTARAGALVAIVALSSTLAGCQGDTAFDVRQANDFAPASRVSVSVLGVFKDGFLSAETWDTLAPRLAPALHSQSCQTLYDPAFVQKNANAAAALDEYTRANGVTEPLLTELAPAAEGDLLMILSVSGHAELDKSYNHDTGSPMPGLAPATGRTGGGTGNGYGGGVGATTGPSSPAFNGRTQMGSSGPRIPQNAYEMTASFYSISQRRTVAAVTMKYTGPRESDALQRFADKLSTTLPNATCVGFHQDVKLDEEKLKTLAPGE